MKTAIIVQARIGSTRLPGKVLLPIMGRPVMEYGLERLRRARSADQVIIATSENPADNSVVDLAEKLGFAYYRGSESDVLSRFYGAALTFGADVIVRCNSDCPLIDPTVVDTIINEYHKPGHPYDYVSNILKPTYPTGMHTEVFSLEALKTAHLSAKDPLEREHVTPYIYRRPEMFRLKNVAIEKDISWHRWTLDLPEDFELISRIYKALYPQNPAFTMDDVLRLLDQYPDWATINGHIHKNATV